MATPSKQLAGRGELRNGLRTCRGLILFVALFSVFVNLLMLTGPLFMLQVYDRVLSSRSEETLVALLGLVAMLYLLMGTLDAARARVAARIGARFQDALDARVFGAVLSSNVQSDAQLQSGAGLRDLESIQHFTASPVLFAIFDMPWAPLFIGVIFVFHPLLGAVALGGALVLVVVKLINQWTTRHPVARAAAASALANTYAGCMGADAQAIQGMGMRDAAMARWQVMRRDALHANIRSSDQIGLFTSMSRSFRFFLQSLVLAVGAWLVLDNQIQAGAMIAASILLGRALAPVEQAIAGWPIAQRARLGWRALGDLLDAVPVDAQVTRLPRPKARLEVEQITVLPPGTQTAALRMLSFDLEPGQALGVIGQSASGKTTLARALTGILTPVAGKIRLDGATLEQYSNADLGTYIGYLPQDVALFPGTVAENIARLGEPDPAKLVDAAEKAGAHDMILKLTDGYDTVLSEGGGRLSGGQKQRIGLARALYGDPVLLILDEPNSQLDADGADALNSAIRDAKADRRSVIVMAHRPSGIAECDKLLVLEGGLRRAFGPRDEVLRAQVRNYDQLSAAVRGDL